MKKITMSQLAEMAEVSTTTLRHYLNDEKVGEDAAKKIKAAIKKSGYVMDKKMTTKAKKITKTEIDKKAGTDKKSLAEKKNTSAKKAAVSSKTLMTNKGCSFAILTKDMTNPKTRKTIKALQSVCYNNNCLFATFITEGKATLEERYTAFAIAQHVDAIIIESCNNPVDINKQAKSAHIPCVFLNNLGKELTSLAVDEEQAGATLGNYLIDKHHLVIRYLGADDALAAAHVDGIRNAFLAKKQPLDFDLKMSNGSHLDNYEKIKEIFSEKIDILVLEYDEMAIALNKYLKEYHIAVPQNASIISFGGHAITRVMSPTLTCLAFDYNTYAEYVCATIFAIISNKAKPSLPQIYHIQNGDSVR